MRVTKRQQWIGGAGLVVVLVVLALMRPAVIVMDLVTLDHGALSVTIDEDGITRLRHHAEVAAPITGRLEESTLTEGDSVARGQVVARIAPVPLDAREVMQAEANLAAARSAVAEADARVSQAVVAHEEAVRARDRAQRLSAAGALSDREREEAEATERITARDVEAARAVKAAAGEREQAARTALLGSATSGTPASALVTVRSPMAGRVLRLMEEHERVVPAGTPLLDVGAPGDIEVVIDVLSSDATRIAPGTPVVVRIPHGDTLQARVDRVDPAAFTKVSPLGVEEQRVNVIARLDGTPTGVGDRFRVEASIVLWRGESVLAVPATSLVPLDEGWAVYVVADGRAHLRAVTVGHQGARTVEVTQGLAAGEVVIRHPDERISDGTRVEGRGQRAE